MKTKITQLLMLLVALLSFNLSANAQSGDFEFLFETDGDTEGWIAFNGDAPTVSAGVLTYTYGESTAGIQLNPPANPIYLDKANYPYLAIKLSATPSVRRYMYLKTNGTGAWWKNKANPEPDADLDSHNIVYYDISGDYFTTSALSDGAIERLIFNFEDASAASVNIEWIKTFSSREAIAAYAGITLSTNDVTNANRPLVFSVNKEIKIQNCEIKAEVGVYSLLGKQLHRSMAKSDELAVKINQPGIYIVKIKSDSGVFTKKIIVE